MKDFPALAKNFIKRPKVQLWLCGLGVVVAMSIVASLPPLSRNGLVGVRPVTAAKAIGVKSSSSDDKSFVFQSAVVAGQASTPPVQGTAPMTTPSPDPMDNNPAPTPPPTVPINQPCYSCGGPHMMCPQIVGYCPHCGGTVDSVCLIEE